MISTCRLRPLKLGRRPSLYSALILSLVAMAASMLAPSRAEALMVTVGGTNYDIGFVEGCFTSNDLTANPPFYPGCGTGYTTPDLYANGTGVLTSQLWWGNEQLAKDFTRAYRDAALAVSNNDNNLCIYNPNVGGAGCDDSPYFAYAANVSQIYPFYDGWGYYFWNDPNTDYLRQSGYFAVQSAPVPGPLPILGVGAAFAYSRRLRRRLTRANGPVSTNTATADQL
jgi:hypothetical protein